MPNPIVGAVGGSALGFLGASKQADAQVDAAKAAATPQIWGPADPYAKYGLSEARNIYEGGISPYYPGVTTAGASPLQQAAFNMAPGMFNTSMDAWQAAQQGYQFDPQSYFANPFGSAANMTLMNDPNRMLNPDNNPYFQRYLQSVTGNIQRNYDEVQMPRLAAEAAMMGGSGGSADYMNKFQAQYDVNKNIGDVTAQMGNEAYGQGLQHLQAGAQAALTNRNQTMAMMQHLNNLRLAQAQGLSGIAGMPMDMMSSLYNLGAQQRGITNEQIAADKARWDYYQNPYAWLGQYNTQVAPYTNFGSASGFNPTGPDYGGGIMSGMNTGIGLAGMFGGGGSTAGGTMPLTSVPTNTMPSSMFGF